MIKVGIIGGAGYAAGELLRLLVNHDLVEIVFVQSESHAGKQITEVHSGLDGEIELEMTAGGSLTDIDCLFMCAGHGASQKFWETHQRPEGLKVIDLAQDYRDESAGYVYGLTELWPQRVESAQSVANPGCFATALQLALLPLASRGLLPELVSVTGITGSTGAGARPAATTHFSWRTDNLSVYKPFTHQHLLEVNRTLHVLQPQWKGTIDFIPMRGDFARGIFTSLVMHTPLCEDEVCQLYKDFYSESPFVFVSAADINLKQVVNTNKCAIGIAKDGERLLITCAIDNLLKGAAGQAVENMNLMFGQPRHLFLNLKASTF